VPFAFTAERQAAFNELLTHYPTKRAAMLPTLHLAQEQNGYISRHVMEYVAELLEVSPAQVQDVVSFYPMFFEHPVGKHIIRVCKTLPCMLCNCRQVLDHMRQKLGVDPDETTPDGAFTLLEVECLAACDRAPVMMVNDELYGNLTPEAVDKVLAALTNGDAPKEPAHGERARATHSVRGH
jgi:NADH-quinone oxidoreductase E subunit